MLFRTKLYSALCAATLLAGLAGTTQAAVVYNSTLGSFDAGGPNSLFGFGTTDTNFALGSFLDSTGATVELGLRARYRVRPSQPSDAGGLYGPFDQGTQTAAFGSPARADRAEWSYDFYINTNNADTSDLSYQLCADLDEGAGFTPDCVNPLTAFADNRVAGTELGNSMQLFFAGTPGNAGYDVNAVGLYSFTLTAFEGVPGAGLTTLGTTSIVAQVGEIPEPTSLALMGLGFAALGVARRRKAGSR
jgi:hypothetical protein